MRWHIPSCVIQVLPLAEAATLEKITTPPLPQLIGYTASKRIGNAVKRNRAKRRLRAAAFEVLNNNPDVAPFAVVLVAKAPVLSQPFTDLTADLKKALRILCTKYGAAALMPSSLPTER